MRDRGDKLLDIGCFSREGKEKEDMNPKKISHRKIGGIVRMDKIEVQLKE